MLFDGKLVSQHILTSLQLLLQDNDAVGKINCVIIYNSSNKASNMYAEMKKKRAEKIGINMELIDVSNEDYISEAFVIDLIEDFNNDDNVHGIMVQEPLFNSDNSTFLSSFIDANKDIDGLSDDNRLFTLDNKHGIWPATPRGVWTLLKHYHIQMQSKNIVVIGRSKLFGQPMSQIFTNENANVTLLHSYTNRDDMMNYIHNADIIVLGVGKKDFLTDLDLTFEKEQTIIDVGMNYENGKAFGDFTFYDESNKHKVNYTPTPGGTGPMTVASLMSNIISAAYRQGVLES